jgi:purine-binding chemotaxis protein CheW
MAKIDLQKTEKILKKTLAKGFVGSKTNDAVKEQIQLIVFGLEEEEYAVEISEVREILRMMEIVPIPNAPSFIRGIINVRGKIVVVTDLRKRFGLQTADEDLSQHIILAEIDNNIYGAIVDQVDEVLRLPKDVVQEAPAIISQKINADYVKGIVPVNDRLIILLDFNKVFSEKGLAELGDMLQNQAEVQRKELAREQPQPKKASEKEKAEELEDKLEKHFKEELNSDASDSSDEEGEESGVGSKKSEEEPDDKSTEPEEGLTIESPEEEVSDEEKAPKPQEAPIERAERKQPEAEQAPEDEMDKTSVPAAKNAADEEQAETTDENTVDTASNTSEDEGEESGHGSMESGVTKEPAN